MAKTLDAVTVPSWALPLVLETLILPHLGLWSSPAFSKCFSLADASAKSVSELHALSVNVVYMRWNSDGAALVHSTWHFSLFCYTTINNDGTITTYQYHQFVINGLLNVLKTHMQEMR